MRLIFPAALLKFLCLYMSHLRAMATTHRVVLTVMATVALRRMGSPTTRLPIGPAVLCITAVAVVSLFFLAVLALLDTALEVL